ncbi:MAG: YihY/virulence factor BrkB family protein [Solirubrobacterales bacterium]|nr:YihY/virulence factor BrkB family protein [Solirubrobacterales bacterium]
MSAPEDHADDRTAPLKLAWRAFGTYREHGMTDYAATLTYFAMLSLFPGLLVGVSLLGLLGQASLATDAANYVADNGADDATAEVIKNSLRTLFESSGSGVGIALAISLALGLNGASGAFGAAGRALNVVHAVDDDRGFVRRKLSDIGATLVVILLFAVVLVSLFLGGGIADDIFGTIGLGDTGALVWSIARWPVALLFALLGFAIVYAFAPDTTPRRFRWITPGATVAVLIWIAASIGFAFYVRGFSSYGAAYGAFGAAIILLLWLYISANAFLFGAELNMAIEREDTAGRGGPPMVSPPPSADRPIPSASAPAAARELNPAQVSGGPGASSSG